MLISLGVINVGITSIVQLFARRRFSAASTLVAMPAALLLVFASVLVSRFLGVQPGFLFGLILGVSFAVELGGRREAQIAMLGIGLTIVVGLGAWLGYGAIVGAHIAHPGFWMLLLQETLVATTAEALATMVIGLLPLEFFDGKVIWRWSKWAWGITYAVAVAIFVIVVLPMSGNWGQVSGPLFGWGGFFVIFALLAIGLWAWFRYRKVREPQEG
jgi:hypothetical protein